MAQPRKISSPTAQYFAEILRTLRSSAELSQTELGSRMNYTGAAVSAVETCAKPATDDFCSAAEKALSAGGIVGAAAKYLRLDRYPEHFQGFVQLEQDALSVSSFCTQVVHGLLQTEAYARALLTSAFPPVCEEELEQLVQARVERGALLSRKPACVVNIIMEETALRRRLGGRSVLKEQYAHLLKCAEFPNVVLQVMPAATEQHAGLLGPLTIIETSDCERLAYMECNGSSTLVARPEEVGVLARRCAMIGQQALRPAESVAMIEQMAGEL